MLNTLSIFLVPNIEVSNWANANLINPYIIGQTSNLQFLDVVERVSVIHFNLEGLGSPQEALAWARKEGIPFPRLDSFMRSQVQQGIIPPEYIFGGQFLTANELRFIATHKDICAKTIFYSSGGRGVLNPPPQISVEAKAIICGS
jgi:hypothetical protein